MPASGRACALVTGGTGIVGRRVARRLAGAGWDVAILTRQHNPSPVEGATFMRGDLGDPASLVAGVAGRDLVVHCALSKSGLDVRAAGHLADAAIGAGVRRLVHVSTMSVYPVVARGTVDESWGYVAPDSPDVYAVTKSHIERAILARADRLHVGILQPANVVSPDGGWWTSGIVALMKSGRLILVDDGAGTANLVHVDDVAAAAVLAATTEYASGSRFLIADGHPGRWRDYLGHLDKIVGGGALAPMTWDAAKRYSRGVRDRSGPARVIRGAMRRLTGARPIWPMDDITIDRFASQAAVSIEHARRVLGFSPAETAWPSSVP